MKVLFIINNSDKMEKEFKTIREVEVLKQKLKKEKASSNIWKYCYENKLTEFIEKTNSIYKDFFKGNKEVKNFIKILKIELTKGKLVEEKNKNDIKSI